MKNPKTYLRFIFLCCLSVLGVSCAQFGSGRVFSNVPLAGGAVEDFSIPAITANDSTIIIEGCQRAPQVGYAYCRILESENIKEKLILHFPPVKCQKTNCVYVKIIRPNGLPELGLALKEGQTELELPWTTILNRDRVQAGDSGHWLVIAEIQFLNKENILKKVLIEGEIRLRVLNKEYMKLDQIKEDSNYNWEWENKGRKMKMTTSGRSYVDSK